MFGFGGREPGPTLKKQFLKRLQERDFKKQIQKTQLTKITPALSLRLTKYKTQAKQGSPEQSDISHPHG